MTDKMNRAEQAASNARRKIDEVLKKNDSKITVGWQPSSKYIKRTEGETWTDDEGTEWIFKDGTARQLKSDIYQSARMPYWCPNCGNGMNHRFDRKMWTLHNKCYDCVIKMETQLRIEGKWEEYENKKVKANMLAFLRDRKNQLESYVKELKKPEYILADDKQILMIERWNVDIDTVRADITAELQQIDHAIEVVENAEHIPIAYASGYNKEDYK